MLTGFLSVLGCEPVISREHLSRVFNGVPVLPSKEALCGDYYEKLKARQSASVASAAQKNPDGSKHPPFAERRCNDCHGSEGQVSNALLKPKEELCFLCHKNIIKGRYAHGPAGSGDCLSCHEPHESANQALLSKPRSRVCENCHVESRVAAGMHEKVSQHMIACPDCHDPHSGTTRYFLK